MAPEALTSRDLICWRTGHPRPPLHAGERKHALPPRAHNLPGAPTHLVSRGAVKGENDEQILGPKPLNPLVDRRFGFRHIIRRTPTCKTSRGTRLNGLAGQVNQRLCNAAIGEIWQLRASFRFRRAVATIYAADDAKRGIQYVN